MLDESEVEKVVVDTIAIFGASGMKDMGRVMGVVVKRLQVKQMENNINFSEKQVILNTKGPVVQLDRISDFGSDGWGFESLLGHKLSSRIIKYFWGYFITLHFDWTFKLYLYENEKKSI